jgi:hypothetical protein
MADGSVKLTTMLWEGIGGRRGLERPAVPG